jgi:hypothetical protein
MRVLVLSNCVTPIYVYALRALFPDWTVKGVRINVATDWLLSGTNREFSDYLEQIDLYCGCPLDGPSTGALAGRLSTRIDRIIIPTFAFRALHPDAFHLQGHASVLKDGTLHSRIACASLVMGLSVSETLDRFNDNVYGELGYLDLFDEERGRLIARFGQFGIDLSDAVDQWRARGNFLYTYNHPKRWVVASILVRALRDRYLERARIHDAQSSLESLEDPLANGIVWPVYPGIGIRYAIEEPFVWRTSTGAGAEELGPEEFVRRTFARLTETGGIGAGSIPNFDLLAGALGTGAK